MNGGIWLNLNIPKIGKDPEVPLQVILDFLAEGYSYDEIRTFYPNLTQADILKGLKWLSLFLKDFTDEDIY